MADEISVRLGGDNSSFRAMLDRSASDAEKFSGDIAGRVAGKLTGMRDISNAVATALGINLTNIAENIARWATDMSKDVEEAYKKLDVVGAQVADANIKNMRAMLTEEQVYTLNLRERDKLQKQISETVATTAPQQLAMKQAELKLSEKQSEILSYEKKQREELAKVSEAAFKTQVASAEKASQTQIDTLQGVEKIAILKGNIAATEAVLASGSLNAADTERFRATLAERKNQLTTEEAKLQGEVAADRERHAARMEEATKKEIQDKRELMTFNQEMAAYRQDEKGWLAVLADHNASEEVHRRAEFELAKTREKMRDVESGKKKEDIELATLLLIPAEQLTATDKLRIDILTGIVTKKQLEAELTDLMAKQVAGTLTPAERERLAVLIGQSGQLANQASQMDGLTKKAKEFVMTLKSKGPSYTSQSDDALGGSEARLKSELDAIKRENAMARPNYRNPMEWAVLQELNNVQGELEVRGKVRDYASRFGEARTRAEFGDELTNRSLSDLTAQSTRTTTAIEDIQARLAKLLPKTT